MSKGEADRQRFPVDVVAGHGLKVLRELDQFLAQGLKVLFMGISIGFVGTRTKNSPNGKRANPYMGRAEVTGVLDGWCLLPRP